MSQEQWYQRPRNPLIRIAEDVAVIGVCGIGGLAAKLHRGMRVDWVDSIINDAGWEGEVHFGQKLSLWMLPTEDRQRGFQGIREGLEIYKRRQETRRSLERRDSETSQ